MNMDKRIRQAFQDATPNLLPAPDRKTKPKKRFPAKLRDALPVMASLAILISALTLGIVNFEAWFGPFQTPPPTQSLTQTAATYSFTVEQQLYTLDLREDGTASFTKITTLDAQAMNAQWNISVTDAAFTQREEMAGTYTQEGDVCRLTLERLLYTLDFTGPDAEAAKAGKLALHQYRSDYSLYQQLCQEERTDVTDQMEFAGLTLEICLGSSQIGALTAYEADGETPDVHYTFQNNVADTKSDFQDGVLFSKTAYYPGGQVKELWNYRTDGTLIGHSLFYENGNTKEQTYYLETGEIDRHSEYYEDGKPALLVFYKDGVIISQLTYDETGKVISEISGGVPSPDIGEDRAKEIALAYLGLAPEDVQELTIYAGTNYYTIRVTANDITYRVLVNRYDPDDFFGKQEEITQPMPVGSSSLCGYKSEWRRRALTMVFTSAKEIDLAYLFDCGFEEEPALTDAELAALPEGTWHRLPADRMETVLQENFGLSLADMSDAAFQNLRYLDSTGCWYAPDLGVQGLDRQDVAVYDYQIRLDGSLVIYYENDRQGRMAAILRRVQDYRTWHLVMNGRPEDIPADTLDLPEGMLTFAQAAEKAAAYLGVNSTFALGSRDGEEYTIYLQVHDNVLYEVKLNARTGEVQSWQITDIVEGGAHTALESAVLMFGGADFNPHHHFTGLEELRIALLLTSPLRDESTEPTPEERAALAGLLPGLDSELLIRLPAEKLDELLRTRFGTTADDLIPACFEGMVYLEATDCWYFTVAEENRYHFGWIDDYQIGDGGIFITYWDSGEIDSNMPVEDRAQFLLAAKFIPGGTWKILYNVPLIPQGTEPPVEHVCAGYYTEVIPSTCTGFGSRISYCTCGKKLSTSPLAPTGHSWGPWYTVQEPTVFEEGLQECACTVCGETKTDIILKLEGYSGTLGDNLTWTLDGNGLLTVSGAGEMHSPGPYNAWQPYRDHIRSVVIEDGVTTVGQSAFRDCIYLETVTLPEGLTKIGQNAFNGCSALRTVSIPSTLVTISGLAFHYCENLEAITLPEGLTSIGKYAFVYCAKLQTVRIPDTVTTIGEGAFQLCYGLEQITLSASLKTLCNSLFQECQGLTEIEIPESVTTIEPGALNAPNLRCVTLGGKLAKVAPYSFGSAVMEIHYRLTMEEWSQVMQDVVLSSGCIVYCTDGEIAIP